MPTQTNGHTPANVDQIRAAGDLLVTSRRHSIHKAAAIPTEAFTEIGTTGLRQYGGFVLEEWLNQLAGRKAAWVWREMLDNDPTVGAIMFAIRWLARGVEWRVEEGSQPEAAEFVEEAMHDMSHTWGDFVSEALSMLGYGWGYHEIVYKRRQGPQAPRSIIAPAETVGAEADTQEDDSEAASSKYKDGKIGWRKLPIRAQETLLCWEFDGYSGLSAMNQIDWHGGNHVIPIEKALLFRTQTTRANPEGRSILRNAYTSYHDIKGVKNMEKIGIERDLAGIPMITPPVDIDLFSAGNAALLAKVQAMVTGIRRDEYDGLVMPSAGWVFELVSSAGSRQIDTDAVIRRYRQDIATSMLADFVLIGQDAVGSFAMVDVKSDLFGIAIDGVLDLICEVINRYAIPRLLALNGMDVSEPPELAHGSAGRIDLEKVGNFLYQLSGAGAEIPWNTNLLTALFAEAGLPSNFEEDVEEPVPQPEDPDKPDDDMVAVGPPKLAPGQDPWARESHYEPAANQPPPPANGQPPAKPVQKSVSRDNAAYQEGARDRKANRPMQGASQFAATHSGADKDDYPFYQAGYDDHDTAKVVPGGQVKKASSGTIIDVSGKLRQRHLKLSGQLEQEINGALGVLATAAASSYATHATKASSGMLHRLVGRVLRSLNLQGWIDGHLKPILRNHAGRVMADTLQTLDTEIRLELHIADDDAQRITADAGSGLGMRDIEPQVRASIMQAIKDGLERGENPVKTAARIKSMVPAGRFVNAGAGYRSRLIARDQTANMMRASAAAAYESNDNITGVELRDGIFGPPRSDPTCIARDGTVVPKDEASSVHPEHPQCTLMLNPVVSGSLDREPALAAA